MSNNIDWSDLVAQPALAEIEIHVTDREPMLLVGSPGMGATVIAQRIPTLFPLLSEHARRWILAEYDGINHVDWMRVPNVVKPPFRAPHHTVSAQALVGQPDGTESICDRIGRPTGERRFRPGRAGEIHLARFGVLFLDEVIEFSKLAIEALGAALKRMPIESRPLVVASAHPCPCGWFDSREIAAKECVCTPAMIERYIARVAWAVAHLGMARGAGIDLNPITIATYRDPSVPRAECSFIVSERIAITRNGLTATGL